MNKRPSWDEYFLGVAVTTAERSPDIKTKVGCVIVNEKRRVVGSGYNGTPPGFDDSEFDWFGRDKLRFVVHAEANALLHANGGELDGCTLYCTHSPCTECAKMIAACGIKTVVYTTLYRQDGIDLLEAFGITCIKNEEAK